MDTRTQHGFTLWELLVTLLVAGILFGVGIPNVLEFRRNAGMTAAANDLVTGVLMARSEAIKRQAPVTWCLSRDPLVAIPTCEPDPIADSRTHGFVVWVDENDNFDANGVRILTDGTDGNAVVDADELILSRTVPPGGAIMVSASCGYTSFAPSGFTRRVGALCPLTAAGNARSTVLFCDDRGRRPSAGNLSAARIVRIDRPGRAQVLPEIAVVDAQVTVTLPAANVNPTCPPAP